MCNEIKRSHCEKIVKKDGKETVEKKIPYNTLDDAIIKCKEINIKPKVTEKVVPYKCTVCHKYHIGRNGKPITKKYRKKLENEKQVLGWKKKVQSVKNIKFNIVGKIDLSKFSKK